MKKEKIEIIYKPLIDDEEKQIFEEAFGADNISYGQYKTKGMEAGSYDVQLIISLLASQYLTAALNLVNLITILNTVVNKIFTRNNKNIADNGTRPRYTILVIRLAKQWISISNTNKEKKIKISRITANFKFIKRDIELGEQEYSKDKLEKYFNDIID